MIHAKLSADISRDMICPKCKEGKIVLSGPVFVCQIPRCASRYPVVDGCPILINEENSVFAIADYESRRITTMNLAGPCEKPLHQRIKRRARGLIPSVSRSVSDFPIPCALREIFGQCRDNPKILVVGAGDAKIELPGEGRVVYSDVAIGRLTNVIFDAHDIPFPDGYFDAVFAVGVLEHVANPYRCAEEIYRVLKERGFVYAITPFMQQVHMGRYDFTRFTHLGHRRLFRRFTEERSGVANAQGMVLAWSIERFISGFSGSVRIHNKLRSLARFVASPFLLFDKMLCCKAPAYDAASAYYFFGRKSDRILSDRELVREYRGVL